MNKKRKKGFTLIELLVTILILGALFSVVGVTITSIIQTEKEKALSISIKSINTSAESYIKEEKSDSIYWTSLDDEVEYNCTTVGALINKGYLKQNVIGLLIEDKKIDKDTSIRVERYKDTKVYKDEVLFNDIKCYETNEVNLTFNVYGEHNQGFDDWYNNDVTIEIKPDNINQIRDYEYVVNEEVKDLTENNSKTDNWTVKVSDEGVNIDVCVDITNLNDQVTRFCLSDDDKTYNMDKTPPTSPNLTLQIQEGYLVVSNGATDNITKKEDLIYFLSKNSNTTKESANYLYAIDTYLPSGEEVISYVIDEAGNKSTTTTRNLVITDTEDDDPITKHTCSLDLDYYYDTYDDAVNNCDISGDVEEDITYYCKEDSSISSYDRDVVERKCYVYGNITKSGGGTETKEVTYEVDGYSNINFTCKNGAWSQSSMNSSNYGCNQGGSLIKYTCSPDASKVAGKSCSTEGDTTTLDRDCTNYCKKTETVTIPVTYYCDLGWEVSSASSSCKEEGTVKSKTRYVCSLDNNLYSTKSSANDACTKKGTVEEKYYCNITDDYYNSIDLATSSCSNVCRNGTLYNNYCYSFN